MNITAITALSAIFIGVTLGFILKTLRLSASLGMSLILPLCFVLKPETVLIILIVTAIYCSINDPTRESNKRVAIVSILFVFAVILLRIFALNFDKAHFLALSVLCIISVIFFEASNISFSNCNNIKYPRFLSLFLSTISAMIGLAIPTIGIDVGTGVQRYSMGITELFGGIDFIIVVIGLCCVGELLYAVSDARSKHNDSTNTDDATYKPAEFLLTVTLGVPFSEASAIIVGTFALYGIQYPDPLQSLFPDLGTASIATLILAVFIILLYAIPRRRINISPVALYPIFIVAAFIGAYSLNYRLFDMFLLIIFGLLGYTMRRLSIPITPLIICVSFGSRIEEAFRVPLSWSIPSVSFYLFSVAIIIIYIYNALKPNSDSSGNTGLNGVRD